ncbi:MAG: Txe/YoeB family addiction module toxin [Promicromonosporaceae bacterium]|nr:Txe/YoeB family addiction module toxin [Promicromonosporaceae bacterium]
MNLVFSPSGWNDYQWWLTNDLRTLKRLNKLIEATLREPEVGIGKPEKLSGDLSGFWSRRITDEHRLVYRVTNAGLEIVACRYHYSK